MYVRLLPISTPGRVWRAGIEKGLREPRPGRFALPWSLVRLGLGVAVAAGIAVLTFSDNKWTAPVAAEPYPVVEAGDVTIMSIGGDDCMCLVAADPPVARIEEHDLATSEDVLVLNLEEHPDSRTVAEQRCEQGAADDVHPAGQLGTPAVSAGGRERIMSPNKLKRYAILGMVALVALAAEPTPTTPRTAFEPDNDKMALSEVKVCVIVLLATDQNEPVDDRVACIARRVRETYPKLIGFKVHKMMSQMVPVGSHATFDLIDDQKFGVSVDPGANPSDHVQIKIEPPSLGAITYETPCGKFMPIVTPYQTADGRVLILAVRVQPCQCK